MLSEFSPIATVLIMRSHHFQATVHGICSNDFSVNAKQDIATDVTLIRDLSKCDQFIPRWQVTSPLALISGMV